MILIQKSLRIIRTSHGTGVAILPSKVRLKVTG